MLTFRPSEPELVPVYPRRQPVAYTAPPPPQPWPTNPFGDVEPRPAPSTPRRQPRLLLPKGNRVPRAAPVDAYDGGDYYPSRGRKRALSPDARAAAHEVRIMHACGRCHKKRQRVCVLICTIDTTALIELSSVELPDPVSHAWETTSAVWIFHACQSCQRTDGSGYSLVSLSQ